MSRPTRFLLVAAGLLAVARPAAAQSTWDGEGGNGNWSTAANWVGNTVPVSAASAAIVLDGTAQTTTTQDLAALFQLNRLTMGPSAANGFVVNGNALQFAGAGAVIQNQAAAQLRINAAVDFSVATTIDIQQNNAAGAEVVLAGRLTGTGSITVNTAAPGSVAVIASSNNTGFTGGLTIGASAIVQLAGVNALGRTSAVNVGTLGLLQTGTTSTGAGAAFGDTGTRLCPVNRVSAGTAG
jgi:hypothetical protein